MTGVLDVDVVPSGRYKLQSLGYPLATKPEEWQNLAYGDNRDGLIRMGIAFLECPGCNEVRLFDTVDDVVTTIDDSTI